MLHTDKNSGSNNLNSITALIWHVVPVAAQNCSGVVIARIWLARRVRHAIRYNDHLTNDGPTVFAHVCRMGLEGIVSKRMDSRYTSGPSPAWLKSKNPNSEAVLRRQEEE